MALLSRKSRATTTVERDRPILVRGGVSPGGVLTGTLVAFGAMFLLLAVVGGILAATGVEPADLESTTAEAGLWASVALVVATLLAYLWGGYTAGRMGRGAGLLNGLLVPIMALIIGVIVAAVVNAMGADPNLNLPFSENRLPIQGDNLVEFGRAVGIFALVAMGVGGMLGGLAGARWHTKLEHRYLAEHEVADRPADRHVDVTDRRDLGRTETIRDEPGPAATRTAAERRPAQRT
jgi:hypothetical protein